MYSQFPIPIQRSQGFRSSICFLACKSKISLWAQFKTLRDGNLVNVEWELTVRRSTHHSITICLLFNISGIVSNNDKVIDITDVGGTCPSSTDGQYNQGCSCGHGCTWGNCRYSDPPVDCLQDVPGAEWKWNPMELEQGCPVYSAVIPN